MMTAPHSRSTGVPDLSPRVLHHDSARVVKVNFLRRGGWNAGRVAGPSGAGGGAGAREQEAPGHLGGHFPGGAGGGAGGGGGAEGAADHEIVGAEPHGFLGGHDALLVVLAAAGTAGADAGGD